MATDQQPDEDGTDGLPDAEDVPSKCTEFTDDSGIDDELDDDAEYAFAFICPRCEGKNVLRGNPRDFATKPFECLDCGYIPLLEKDAINDFAEEVGF